LFTGLIEEIGKIKEIGKNEGKSFVVVECKRCSAEANEGDSICVNGLCLSVNVKTKNSLLFNVSPETVTRSTFSLWHVGLSVNIEQALTPSSRMGGHFVQGHVDCISEVSDITKKGGFQTIKFRLPNEISSYIVEKGPIAVDGISLTVASCKSDFFETAVIPETIKRSNIREFKKGTKVNLEADLLAKYIEKILHKDSSEDGKQVFYSEENLKKIGFI
jgi:riboflavin synthase